MDGRRALIYSRIRENRLNPAESDITRGQRQQDVIQALLGEMASFRVWLKLPFIGDDLMSPLTTDLSAGQFMQLALVQKRSNREVRCRLGGTPQNFGGGSFIQLDEEARRTILAFRGQSACSPRSPARPSARAAGERPLVDPLRAHRRRGGAARRSRAAGDRLSGDDRRRDHRGVDRRAARELVFGDEVRFRWDLGRSCSPWPAR